MYPWSFLCLPHRVYNNIILCFLSDASFRQRKLRRIWNMHSQVPLRRSQLFEGYIKSFPLGVSASVGLIPCCHVWNMLQIICTVVCCLYYCILHTSNDCTINCRHGSRRSLLIENKSWDTKKHTTKQNACWMNGIAFTFLDRILIHELDRIRFYVRIFISTLCIYIYWLWLKYTEIKAVV